MEDVIIIVNPAAGGGAAGRRWPQLAVRLRKDGHAFDDVLTSGRGDAVLIAQRAAHEGREMVVVVGGDGTVNEIINGILGTSAGQPPAIGVIPMGTGTDLCRTIGIPLDPVAAASVVWDGMRRRIDAGRITFSGQEGQPSRYFLNVADAGIGG